MLFGVFVMGSIRQFQVTKAYLSGTGGSASALDLFKFKQKVRDYLMEVEMSRAGFNLKDLSQMREKLSTHASYRKFVTPMPDAHSSPEVTWQSFLKASSILCLKLVEDTGVFQDIRLLISAYIIFIIKADNASYLYTCMYTDAKLNKHTVFKFSACLTNTGLGSCNVRTLSLAASSMALWLL
jgi:hypothetical protein